MKLITHKSAYRALVTAKMNPLFAALVLIVAVNSCIIVSSCQQQVEASNPIDKHKFKNNTSHHHHQTFIPRPQDPLVATGADSNDEQANSLAVNVAAKLVALQAQDCPKKKDNNIVHNDNNSDEPESSNNQSPSAATFSSSILRSYGRVNRMRAYHLDLHSYRQEALYSGDPSYVNSNNLQHLQRCRRHLTHFHNLIKSFKGSDPMDYKNSLDSIKLADTFGRPESGLLLGNQLWLGSYESCLDLKLADLPELRDSAAPTRGLQNNDNETATLSTQYCLGLTQFPDWNPQDTKLTIRVGLCLPETCTSSMLNTNTDLFELVASMAFMNNFDKPFDRLKLRSIYCLPHETSEIRKLTTSAMVFVALTGSLLFMSLAATVYDYFDRRIPDNLKMIHSHQDPNWRQIIIESFSLIRNYEKLAHLTTSSEPAVATNELDEFGEPVCRFNKTTFFNCIAGIKCIGLIWIIAAHTFLVSPIPSRNLITLDKLTTTYLANLYLTAHLMVDTFFTISGVLAAYLIFKGDISKLRTSHWITMTIHRYWRLTPVYVLTYWFSKSVGQLMSTGPMWDYGTATQSPRLQCSEESWLYALLHLSDFKSPKEHCVPFAWFTANNFKFWLVTPFFLLMIAKSIRVGYKVTIGAIIANILLVIVLAMSSSVDMKSVVEFKPESADDMLNTMGQVYTRPYSRIGAYLIGLLAGHMFYRLEAGQLEIKLSKNTKIIIWTTFSATIMALTFMFKLVDGVKLEDHMIPWVFSISSSLIRPLWALCTCWFIYALSIGQARWAAKFLTADIWRHMVKLSFSAYLIQGEVIASMFLNQTHSGVITYADVLVRPIVTIVVTILVSFLVVLLFEYPLIGIEELILPSKRTPNKNAAKSQSISSSTTYETQTVDQNAKLLPKDGKMKCS